MFLWDELRVFPRPILIYGMGNGADKILALCREYGISITGMFSSDTHAREGMFQGCPVLSRTKALELYPDAMILLGFGTERPMKWRTCWNWRSGTPCAFQIRRC